METNDVVQDVAPQAVPVEVAPVVHFLSADEILESKDFQSEVVACPEWGGSVTVRNMNASERGVFVMQTLGAQTDPQNQNFGKAEALLVALTAVSEAGDRLFTDDQVIRLALKNAAPINRCAEVAMRLSGLTKAAKDVAVKN